MKTIDHGLLGLEWWGIIMIDYDKSTLILKAEEYQEIESDVYCPSDQHKWIGWLRQNEWRLNACELCGIVKMMKVNE